MQAPLENKDGPLKQNEGSENVPARRSVEAETSVTEGATQCGGAGRRGVWREEGTPGRGTARSVHSQSESLGRGALRGP